MKNYNNKERLNEELLSIVEQIKQSPPNSGEWRKFRHKLIKKIQAELEPKSQAIFSGQDKFLIEDARQNTYINVLKYLHTYNPEKAKFVTWVTTIFKNEFYRCLTEHRQAGITKLPREEADGSEEQNKLEVTSLDAKNYDDLPASNNKQLIKRIWEFLKADPENILKNKKIRNHDLSLQEISVKKFEGYTFEEIGRRYSIPFQTVDSFFKRNLKKLEIREYFSRHLDEDYLT